MWWWGWCWCLVVGVLVWGFLFCSCFGSWMVWMIFLCGYSWSMSIGMMMSSICVGLCCSSCLFMIVCVSVFFVGCLMIKNSSVEMVMLSLLMFMSWLLVMGVVCFWSVFFSSMVIYFCVGLGMELMWLVLSFLLWKFVMSSWWWSLMWLLLVVFFLCFGMWLLIFFSFLLCISFLFFFVY